jgi:folylpolyglutamate synthase/dihydropteroate synthase
VERALAIAESSDLICATGSLFLVAEVMEYMRKQA